jgi:MoxR-like ATPase
VQGYLSWGAGPRASEFLVLGAKAAAMMEGSTHVTPDHVRAIAKPVLRHRLMLNFSAEADQVTPDAVIDDLLAHVPVEASTPEQKRRLDEALRSA